MMRMVDKMSLGRIREKIEVYCFEMTDEQFSNLTYSELVGIYKKVRKISKIKDSIYNTLNKPTVKAKEKK